MQARDQAFMVVACVAWWRHSNDCAVPRRLNDVVMAPPQLKSLPRGAAKRSLALGGKVDVRTGAGVLSMAQRAMKRHGHFICHPDKLPIKIA